MDQVDWQQRSTANRAAAQQLRAALSATAGGLAATELALADTLDSLPGSPSSRLRRAALASDARAYADHLTHLARGLEAARQDDDHRPGHQV